MPNTKLQDDAARLILWDLKRNEALAILTARHDVPETEALMAITRAQAQQLGN